MRKICRLAMLAKAMAAIPIENFESLCVVFGHTKAYAFQIIAAQSTGTRIA